MNIASRLKKLEAQHPPDYSSVRPTPEMRALPDREIDLLLLLSAKLLAGLAPTPDDTRLMAALEVKCRPGDYTAADAVIRELEPRYPYATPDRQHLQDFTESILCSGVRFSPEMQVRVDRLTLAEKRRMLAIAEQLEAGKMLDMKQGAILSAILAKMYQGEAA